MVLPEISNGMIVYFADMSPDFELTTTATYSCDDGYFLDLSVGDRVRTCIDDDDNDADGVFTGQAPSCVRKCIYIACTHNDVYYCGLKHFLSAVFQAFLDSHIATLA